MNNEGNFEDKGHETRGNDKGMSENTGKGGWAKIICPGVFTPRKNFTNNQRARRVGKNPCVKQGR